jgi:hypothetical protein
MPVFNIGITRINLGTTTTQHLFHFTATFFISALIFS